MVNVMFFLRMSRVQIAKNILTNSTEIGWGTFCLVPNSGVFPPREFLNEFLRVGSDPAHQDRESPRWKPFELNVTEYNEILEWWISKYPNSKEDNLGKERWNDWIFEIIHGDNDDE